MIEIVEQLLSRIFQGPKQDRHGDLSTPVDPNMEKIFLIEFEIDPGSPIGDDPGIVKDLSPRMGLDLILIKKDTRRTMELADDDPLCSVDDEGPVLRHQTESHRNRPLAP